MFFYSKLDLSWLMYPPGIRIFFSSKVRFELADVPPTQLEKNLQKIICSFLDYIQLLMISKAIRVMKVDQNVKKGPLSHQKMKCSFLDYVQLLMISQAIRVMKINRNVQKDPLSHRKMKCLFFDYIQLLMISQAI